jgi:sporulation protein YlmC with PRC-barrel domain
MTGAGVVRASQLLDYDVENAGSDDLGSIEDALVSLNQGCIDYMILSFGGILGLGDHDYLIPWRAVQIDPANARLLLNIDPQVLNDAPVLDPNNLPDMMAEDWEAPFVEFWRSVTISAPAHLEPAAPMTGTESMTDTTAMTSTARMEGATQPCGQMTATGGVSAEASTGVTGTAAASETGINVEVPGVIRLSDLLGYDVRNPDGEDLGAIEDIMVDWRQDRLAYAILSFGGILGMGEKWFVIPLDQLTLDPLNQRLVVAIEPERLQNAPGYDPNVLPDTSDPNWDEEIRNYWRQIQ